MTCQAITYYCVTDVWWTGGRYVAWRGGFDLLLYMGALLSLAP